jgi:hypothetical protein
MDAKAEAGACWLRRGKSVAYSGSWLRVQDLGSLSLVSGLLATVLKQDLRYKLTVHISLNMFNQEPNSTREKVSSVSGVYDLAVSINEMGKVVHFPHLSTFPVWSRRGALVSS